MAKKKNGKRRVTGAEMPAKRQEREEEEGRKEDSGLIEVESSVDARALTPLEKISRQESCDAGEREDGEGEGDVVDELVETKSRCPHAESAKQLTAQEVEAAKASSCCSCPSGCSVRARWLCLRDGCRVAVCGAKRGEHDHMDVHCKSSSHALFLNLRNNRVFCLACQTEVFPSGNLPAFAAKVQAALSTARRTRLTSSASQSTSCAHMAVCEAVRAVEHVQHKGGDDQRALLALSGRRPTQGRPVEPFAVQNRAISKDLEDAWDDTCPRGLTGLSNLGNTCYFNAAIQALSNCAPFADYFKAKSSLRPYTFRSSSSPQVSSAVLQLVHRLWSQQREPVVSPHALLMRIRDEFPQFRGWQQQDAQELIRCLLELIHRELGQPVYGWEEEMARRERERREDDERRGTAVVSSSEGGRSSSASSESSVNDDEFETADSGLSSDGDTPSTSTSNGGGGGGGEREGRKRKGGVAGGGEEAGERGQQPSLCIPEPARFRSIVSDVFDGQLESTVRCLSCGTLSTTTETFQDLSLPIPSREQLDRIRELVAYAKEARGEDGEGAGGGAGAGGAGGGEEQREGWMEWLSSWAFWAGSGLGGYLMPHSVSLSDCLDAFFSPDRLQGEDMYSCEKCKKLRNGVKTCRVRRLPEVLCLHVKRFRHDSYASSKVSTRVAFPLDGLDVAAWCAPGVGESEYELCGFVTHEGGGADSGHYLAYCRNEIDLNWYEFDDSCVTKLDAGYVLSKEAYVLFYQRKQSTTVEDTRERLAAMLSAEERSKPSLAAPHMYISAEWLEKMGTMADPGPIHNHAFLCRHAHLLPRRVEHLASLATQLPAPAWHMLHERFGGGPCVSSLHYCLVCDEEWRGLSDKRQREFKQWKLLDESVLAAEASGRALTYSAHLPPSLIHRGWFHTWHRFINEPCSKPPGPIDNSSLLVKEGGSVKFNTRSSHMRLPREMFLLFAGIYGGGPEVLYMDGPQPSEKELRAAVAAADEKIEQAKREFVEDMEEEEEEEEQQPRSRRQRHKMSSR